MQENVSLNRIRTFERDEHLRFLRKLSPEERSDFPNESLPVRILNQ